MNSTASKPWAAIIIGAVLSICGILAGAYGIIAVTWTEGTTAKIVQIESPVSAAASSQVSQRTQQGDGPLRTSTTRRRTSPRLATQLVEETETTNDVPASVSTTGSSEVARPGSERTSAQGDPARDNSTTRATEPLPETPGSELTPPATADEVDLTN